MRRGLIAGITFAVAAAMAGCSGSQSPLGPTASGSAASTSATNRSTTASTNSRTPVAPTPMPGTSVTPVPGASCSSVTNGTEVAADGTRQSDGGLLADHVIELPSGGLTPPLGSPSSGAPPIAAPTDDRVAHGTVSGLGGTCPSLTFTLGDTVIVTNASTRFFAPK
jgi:hypothetical protein